MSVRHKNGTVYDGTTARNKSAPTRSLAGTTAESRGRRSGPDGGGDHTALPRLATWETPSFDMDQASEASLCSSAISALP